jgi:hypothetical protein
LVRKALDDRIVAGALRSSVCNQQLQGRGVRLLGAQGLGQAVFATLAGGTLWRTTNAFWLKLVFLAIHLLARCAAYTERGCC